MMMKHERANNETNLIDNSIDYFDIKQKKTLVQHVTPNWNLMHEFLIWHYIYRMCHY